MLDIAQSLTNSLSRDGLGGMRASLNMGGFKLLDMAWANAPGQAVTLDQLGAEGGGNVVNLHGLTKTATENGDDLILATLTAVGASGAYAVHGLHTGDEDNFGGGAIGGACDSEGVAFAGVFNRRTNVSGVGGGGAAISARAWEKTAGPGIIACSSSSGAGSHALEAYKAPADIGSDSNGSCIYAHNESDHGYGIECYTFSNNVDPISNVFERRNVTGGTITRHQVLLGGARTAPLQGVDILLQPDTALTGSSAVAGLNISLNANITGAGETAGISMLNLTTGGTTAHGVSALLNGANSFNYGFRSNVTGGTKNWGFYADNGDFNAQTGAYYVAGVKVVGAQGGVIADASNAAGAPTQAEFNALVGAFNTLLSRLRAHGLIAT